MDLTWLKEKPLVLWGAGRKGAATYTALALFDLHPLCFVDSHPALSEWTDMQGERYIVQRPNWLISQRGRVHVFISVRQDDDIVRELIRMGYVQGEDFISSNEPGVWEKLCEINYSHHILPAYVEKPPLFTMVEIETINRCNNDCPFCPANCRVDKRKPLIMTEELLCSVLDQLAQLNYKGRLCLFSNNEPLLDKHIGEHVRMARQKVPEAFHYLFTNGILLTPIILEELLPYLDELLIDNYSDDMELIPPVRKATAYLKMRPDWEKKVRIAYRLKNEVRLTRAGQAPNRRPYTAPFCGCNLPFMQMIIRPDGKISLCCNDAQGVYTLGDLTKQTLIEIWLSEKYRILRDTMISKGRPALDLCRHCDAHYINYFNLWDVMKTKTLL